GGTASFSGSDYSQIGATTYDVPTGQGTIEFAAGQATATVTVDPTVDDAIESDETVILTATSGTGYVVGSPAAATGTITNDDAAPVLTVIKHVVTDNGGTATASNF